MGESADYDDQNASFLDSLCHLLCITSADVQMSQDKVNQAASDLSDKLVAEHGEAGADEIKDQMREWLSTPYDQAAVDEIKTQALEWLNSMWPANG